MIQKIPLTSEKLFSTYDWSLKKNVVEDNSLSQNYKISRNLSRIHLISKLRLVVVKRR